MLLWGYSEEEAKLESRPERTAHYQGRPTATEKELSHGSRKYDVEDAAFYNRLMKRGLHHNQAITAVARRLAARSYAVMKRVQEAQQGLRDRSTVPFQLRDLDGTPITPEQARQIVQDKYPSKSKASKKKKERTQPQVCVSRQSLNSSNMEHGQPLPIGDLLKNICTDHARQEKSEAIRGG